MEILEVSDPAGGRVGRLGDCDLEAGWAVVFSLELLSSLFQALLEPPPLPRRLLSFSSMSTFGLPFGCLPLLSLGEVLDGLVDRLLRVDDCGLGVAKRVDLPEAHPLVVGQIKLCLDLPHRIVLDAVSVRQVLGLLDGEVMRVVLKPTWVEVFNGEMLGYVVHS